METSTVPFDTLWDQMHERLCWFVCSRMSNPQDAEDILQDVFLRAYDQMASLRDPQRLESWMYQVARNRVIDTYRRRRNWVDLTEALEADEDVEEPLFEDLQPSLRVAVHSLPEPYREALLLSDFRGLPQQDLAGRIGTSLSGAKSRVQRARIKVKEALRRCFDFELDARGQVMEFREHSC